VKNQSLGELLRETDALTFLNALKMTLTEVKEELSKQNEMAAYLELSRERVEKLQRRFDNQYRLLVKLAMREAPTADVTVEDDTQSVDQLKELMGDV
jgi:hypothetical protein